MKRLCTSLILVLITSVLFAQNNIHAKRIAIPRQHQAASVQFQAPAVDEVLQQSTDIHSLAAGNARITLTTTNVWSDGTGYQMLLDADADTYGRIIPDPAVISQGTLIKGKGDVSAEIYAEFEYKIPENADGALNTSNIVMNNSITIDIPAGTYDYVIVNPTPDTGDLNTNYMWIASGSNTRGNDYIFEEGKLYHFSVSLSSSTGNDQTILTIIALDVSTAVSDFQAVPNPNPSILSCDLSWKNPSVTQGGDPLTNISLITIMRDGNEIHTIDNPTPGLAMTWTDNAVANGYHTYTMYVTNDAGDSPVAIVEDVLVGVDPCTIAISDFPYNQGFEDTDALACWNMEYVSGNIGWGIRKGSTGGIFTNKPHSGSYNAFFYNSSYNDVTTKLISHKLDITSLNNPSLSFWFGQENWNSDQDELRVYYKTSANGEWNKIFEHTERVTEWTMVTLPLPAASADYYIAFEGTARYGRGVVLDDITIKNLPLYDASVVSIEQPQSGANLTNAETVAITVRNNGVETISNFTVKFEVNGIVVGTETITVPIVSMAEYKYVFTTKADLSSVETYTIKAYTELANDANADNNAAIKEVINYGNVAIMGSTPSYTACNFKFVDDGIYKNYIAGTNETQIITLFPAEAGKKLKIDFTELYVSEYYVLWILEVPGDTLFVYQGNTVDESKRLAVLTGDYSGNLPAFISYADDGSLTFVFKKSSGESRSGWLADVSCITLPDNDAGVTSIISPKKGGANNAQVTVRFKNYGLNTITSMDIAYKINNAPPIVETFTGNVASGEVGEYTFIRTTDLSAFDTYQLEVYTQLSGDSNIENDKISTTIEFKPNVQIYGYRIFENENQAATGFVSFNTHNPEAITIESTYTDENNFVNGGTYYDNKLYLYTYNNNAPANFVQLTDSWNVISTTPTNHSPDDLTYDYSTGVMYSVEYIESSISQLSSINMETGEPTPITQINLNVVATACHLDGRLFAISVGGDLYTINKTTGETTLVGTTGVVPSDYFQSMTFDHESGRLFWAYISESTNGSLYEIDPATGAANYLGLIGNSSEIVSLYIPYNVNTDLPETEALNHIMLYPNPASTTAQLSGIPENSHITIYDISGHMMKQYKATMETFDINIDFETGIYFVTIEKDNKSVVKKLVVK